jgi:hypothetical protein
LPDCPPGDGCAHQRPDRPAGRRKGGFSRISRRFFTVSKKIFNTRLNRSDFSEMAADDSELASLAPERARPLASRHKRRFSL